MPFISASKRWTYEKFRDNDDDGFNSCRVSDSLGSKKKLRSIDTSSPIDRALHVAARRDTVKD